MTMHISKPAFSDRESYLEWRDQWRAAWKMLSTMIANDKRALKTEQNVKKRSKLQSRLHRLRSNAAELMKLLQEAKERRARIFAMHADMKAQFDSFPLSLPNCRHIDFHFNKGSLEYPFLPMWTLKTQGKSFYIHHIDAKIEWSTRELPEGSTRGMIRLRRGDLHISKEGIATITPVSIELKEVA